ncbi:MAG: helix-turn-helix domain-containing protein [Ktedonobacterales bacterium]
MRQGPKQTGQGTRRAATSRAHTTTRAQAAMPRTDDMIMQAKMALVAAREQNAAGALGQVLATYPQYVPELTEFSTALMATTSYEREALTPDVVSIAERARARALAAVFPAQAAPQTAVQAAFASLKELRRARKLSPVAVAQRLGLGVDVVSDLEAGLIRVTTIPQRFVRALGEVLDATAEQINTILRVQATALPAMLRSSEGASKDAPEQQARDFGEAVRHSPNMSQDQKAHWLDE